MSLTHRERHHLYRIESSLLRSDPHLTAMLAVFARLSAGQRMPAWEQLATRLDRIRQATPMIAQATTMIAQAITAAAAAVGFLAAAVRTLLSAIVGRRARRPQPARQQSGPGTDGRPNPAGWA
jgi:hypothetical protein